MSKSNGENFVIEKGEKKYRFTFEKEGKKKLIVLGREENEINGDSYRGVFSVEEITQRYDLTISSVQSFLDGLTNSFKRKKIKLVLEETTLQLRPKLHGKEIQLSLSLTEEGVYSKLSAYGALLRKYKNKIRLLSERFKKGKDTFAWFENKQKECIKTVIQHQNDSQKQIEANFNEKINAQNLLIKNSLNDFHQQITTEVSSSTDKIIKNCLNQLHNTNVSVLKEIQQNLQDNFNQQFEKIHSQQAALIEKNNLLTEINQNLLLLVQGLSKNKSGSESVKQPHIEVEANVEEEPPVRNGCNGRIKARRRAELPQPNKRSGSGLSNLGNTCFMDSCLQVLFSTPPLIEQLLQIKYQLNSCPITENFIRLFELIKNSREKSTDISDSIEITLNRFCSQFSEKHPNFKIGRMNDANLFMMTLFSDFESDTKRIQENLISDIFYIRISSTSFCRGCNREMETRTNNFLQLTINPAIETYGRTCSFEKLLAGELFSEKKVNTIKPCESCGSKEKIRKNTIMEMPEVLIVKFEKSKKTVEFPEVLDLSPTLGQENLVFHLYGLIIHSGTNQGGHYISKVKLADKWFYFCDSDFEELENPTFREKGVFISFYIKSAKSQ